jgi:hypothetical protein
MRGAEGFYDLLLETDDAPSLGGVSENIPGIQRRVWGTI